MMIDIFQNFLEEHQKIKFNQIKINKTNQNSFNFLDFMRTDEMGLSKLLAFLLDPKQSHHQGNLFLNSFLECLGLNNFKNNFDFVYVFNEYSTLEDRRHDIFIQGVKDNKTSWVISIENKLRGACDQPTQIADYFDDLERYHKENHFLLYLPSYKKNPSKESILNWEEKKGKVWTPIELSDWLSNLEITSDRTKMLVDDFIIFLETEILGMNQLNSELLDFVLESEKNRELALDIFSLQENFYQSLKNTLIHQLNDKLKNDECFVTGGWKLITENEKYKYELIQLVSDNYPFVIHFEKSSTGMYYGFKWKDLNDLESQNKYLPIIQKIPGGTTSPWWGKWMWCPKLPINIKNWDKHTWLSIESGALADQIWSCVHQLWSQFLNIKTIE